MPASHRELNPHAGRSSSPYLSRRRMQMPASHRAEPPRWKEQLALPLPEPGIRNCASSRMWEQVALPLPETLMQMPAPHRAEPPRWMEPAGRSRGGGA